MIKAVLASLSCTLLATTPAFAEDSMTGTAHVEGQLALDHLRLTDQTGSSAAGTTTGNNRLLVGIGAGYDLPVGGGLLAGVDAGVMGLGKSACASSVTASGDQLCSKVKRDISAGARLGYQAGPALLFGRVAYDNSRVGSTYTASDGTTVTTAAHSTGSPQVGGGVELGLGAGLYGKAEYRYNTRSDGTYHQSQLLTGVGIKF
ncbi:hypothetical protein HMF7854_13400 [Sphingomonas ginkgonis]|uniref:Outer membrane protein beta-barrel domain-containing protein n=1 Tax=Sphingomonas ginkgonis TaxID=2315330 RepID=A0A429VCN9_9SPHN|nr:outer membrane beta-barrel protein [Sphingomonas ginkgonis]RST31724.1 hypothetical protein HMF7854_13400 [Sphingomonas ginkgonis]